MERTLPVSVEEDQEGVRRAIGLMRLAMHELMGALPLETGNMPHLLQSTASRHGNQLTTSELDVAAKFAEGMDPAQIAETRRSKERTINNQLAAAIRKLGFDDRREFRGWAQAMLSRHEL